MAAYLIKDNILDHNDQQAEAVTSFDLVNAKSFPLVTLCWNERDFLRIMAETCGHSTQTNQLNFLQILQSCLAANMTIDQLLNQNGMANRYDLDTWNGWNLEPGTWNWIEIRPFNGSSYFKTSVSGQWSMLIHPKLGPCYSFEIDKFNSVDDNFFYPNYSESKTFSSKFDH